MLFLFSRRIGRDYSGGTAHAGRTTIAKPPERSAVGHKGRVIEQLRETECLILETVKHQVQKLNGNHPETRKRNVDEGQA